MILKVILFLSQCQGWIWDADLFWCCCGRDNKQVFLLAFGRAEIKNADAKLVVPFVAAVLCGLGIVIKETFGCLVPVACKFSTVRCSCCIYDFLQSNMLAPDTVLHCQTDFYRCMMGPVLCGFWVLCPTQLAIHIIYSLTLQGMARRHWETHWKFHFLLVSL